MLKVAGSNPPGCSSGFSPIVNYQVIKFFWPPTGSETEHSWALKRLLKIPWQLEIGKKSRSDGRSPRGRILRTLPRILALALEVSVLTETSVWESNWNWRTSRDRNVLTVKRHFSNNELTNNELTKSFDLANSSGTHFSFLNKISVSSIDSGWSSLKNNHL